MDNLTKDSLIDFFKEPTLENFSEFFEKISVKLTTWILKVSGLTLIKLHKLL